MNLTPVTLPEVTDKLNEVLYSLFGSMQMESQHMQRTAERVVRYWQSLVPQPVEMLDDEFTVFENNPPVKQLIMTNTIPFHSACAHHLMPFEGHAYVGYKPDAVICGLSKLPRAVKFFAQRPQTQEWLARDVADYLNKKLKPTALIVVLDAVHTCTTCRGVEAPGTTMTTSVVLGDAQRYEAVKNEFFELLRPYRGG